MSYEVKNFDRLIGTKGFSDQLLKNHFTLYSGYVNNTNKLIDSLKKLLKEGKGETIEFSEMKRRLGWEFNGMRLHELYFENLKNGGIKVSRGGKVFNKIVEDFGSYEEWEKEFKILGMMRGIGWIVLYYDPIANTLFNVWVNEHDSSHLVGCKPVLVMDVFEHAFISDYGLKKSEYINAFFEAIDWDVVESRFIL
ncbi:MAG: Fe-Mn family superoxide dismutase [Candidatus Pacearchaeota archaeon]